MSTVEKIIDGLLVEWDEKKAAINKQKHGVNFEDAALVFADDNLLGGVHTKESIIMAKRIKPAKTISNLS